MLAAIVTDDLGDILKKRVEMEIAIRNRDMEERLLHALYFDDWPVWTEIAPGRRVLVSRPGFWKRVRMAWRFFLRVVWGV